MTLVHQSYERLFPGKEFPYKVYFEYNRRLSDFNANIRLHQNTIYLHLNLQWKDIDDEIKIGLIQHLLLKLFKTKRQNQNLELYFHFIKNIPLLAEKTVADPALKASFLRTNQSFFGGQLEQPNLRWGQRAFRKLASYNFHNDTITISSVFRKADHEVLDYLMYHEMLHHYFKFTARNGRSSYHHHAFRNAEKLYPRQKQIEKEISAILKNHKKLPFFAALERYF